MTLKIFYIYYFFFHLSYLILILTTDDYQKVINNFKGIIIDSKDEHQEFGSIAFVLAKNQFFRQALKDLTNMSHPLMNPLFLDEAECSTPVDELLTSDFLQELNVPAHVLENTSPQNSDELRQAIEKAMAEANFSKESISQMSDHFFNKEGEKSTGFFFAAKHANDNARRYGFPSFAFFNSLISLDKFDYKRRVYNLGLSTNALIKNIEINPLILSDTPAHPYKNLLKKYCQTSKTPGMHKRLVEIGSKTRKNIVHILTHHPDVLSLNDFAHNELPLQRLASRQKVTMIQKIGNKQELSLTKLQVFNCFLCPPTTDSIKNSEIHESLLENPSLQKVNVKRLIAYEGPSDFFLHLQKEHQKLVDERCFKVIPCRECLHRYILDPSDKSQIENAFVCCSPCAVDHVLIHHKTNEKLAILYLSLEQEFQHHKLAKEMLEKYLFTKCIACGSLFETQEKLNSHEEICFASFVSLSSGYGRPLSQDLFFTTQFLKMKEEEINKDHALQQISKIVQSLSAPEPLLASAAKSAKNGLFPPPPPPPQQPVDTHQPSASSSKKSKGDVKTTLKNKSKKSGETKNKKTLNQTSSVYKHHILMDSDSSSGEVLPSYSSPLVVERGNCDDYDDDDDQYFDIDDDDDILERSPKFPPSHITESATMHENQIWTEAAENEHIASIQFFSSVPVNDTCVSSNGNETFYEPPPSKKKR